MTEPQKDAEARARKVTGSENYEQIVRILTAIFVLVWLGFLLHVLEGATPTVLFVWSIISFDSILCGLLGGLIGDNKNAGRLGFMLGLLFGPLGVIAVFGVDERLQCSRCGGRLNGRPQECLHCHRVLKYDSVSSPQEIGTNDTHELITLFVYPTLAVAAFIFIMYLFAIFGK